MTCFWFVLAGLVVGCGCGYGFRGWLGHKRDALVQEAKGVGSTISKHL